MTVTFCPFRPKFIKYKTSNIKTFPDLESFFSWLKLDSFYSRSNFSLFTYCFNEDFTLKTYVVFADCFFCDGVIYPYEDGLLVGYVTVPCF